MARAPTPLALALASPDPAEAQARRERLKLGAPEHDDFWRAIVALDAALNAQGPLGEALDSLGPNPHFLAAKEIAKGLGDFLPQFNQLVEGQPLDGERRCGLGPALWSACDELGALGLDPSARHALVARFLAQASLRLPTQGQKPSEFVTPTSCNPAELADWILQSARAFPSNEMAIELAFGEAGSWLFRESLAQEEGRRPSGFYEKSFACNDVHENIGRWSASKLSCLTQAWNFSDEAPLSPFAMGCISRTDSLLRLSLEQLPPRARITEQLHESLAAPRVQAVLLLVERQTLDQAAKRASAARAKTL